MITKILIGRNKNNSEFLVETFLNDNKMTTPIKKTEKEIIDEIKIENNLQNQENIKYPIESKIYGTRKNDKFTPIIVYLISNKEQIKSHNNETEEDNIKNLPKML